jgi:predicted NUDIX family NTP pyrophosphohydrolase
LKKSAGILMYRRTGSSSIEVFLIHPGGPFWAKKDASAWSIPKGEINEGEDPLAAARREFMEETGFKAGEDFIELEPIRQKGGKMVFAWAVEGSIDADAIQSNMFSMEWPPRSGRQTEFPEADKAGWFSPDQARGFQTTPQDFQFGECATASSDAHCTVDPNTVPKAMDIITPPGVAQSTALDYTLNPGTPVSIPSYVIP